MASTHKHIRSSTANKRPTTAIADGQIALNTNSTSPGLFFKDSTGATIIKIGPVHVGTTAPNVSPAAGGSSGNSTGEVWLDTSLTPVGVKIWNGSTWTNATPIGSTTVQGLLELATSAETQAGTDTDRAVTPAGLQSKVSDSTSTTSSTTIASSTAVKAAYDLANAALPKSGGTVTGNLEIGTTGSLTFEGSTADAFETTLAVADPTADRIITLPDTTGTVITTGDTGTVTSTMIADGTIVDGDISATAEIAVSKLADGAARQLLQTDAAGTGVEWTSNVDVPGTLDVTGAAVFDSSVSVTGTLTKSGNNVVTVGDTGTVTSAMIADGTIVDADISATAEIAVSKLADGAARQLLQTDAAGTGVEWASNIDIPGTLDVTSAATFDSTIGASAGAAATPSITFTGDLNTGLWSPGADTIAASTAGSERLRIDSSGRVGIGTTSPTQALHVVSATTNNVFIETTSSSTRALFSATGKDSGGNNISALFGPYGDGPFVAIGSTTNHDFRFITNNAERARIDSSGRLLVGTSTATNNARLNSKLALVNAADGTYGNFSITNYGGAAADRAFVIDINRSRGTTDGSMTSVSSGDILGYVVFRGADGTNFTEAALIKAEVDGTPGTNDMPGRLVFATTSDGASAPAERMRIDSSGVVSCIAGIKSVGVYNYTTSGGAANVHIDANYDFRRSTSCLRFKADIETLGDTYADAILNCRPVWYRSLCGGDNPEWGFYGFIAEEVEQIDKRLCTYGPSDDGSEDLVLTGVQYDRFVPHLLNLIKRQQQAIETLEAKVAALENA